MEGKTLSDYLLRELTRFASLPTREEMRERLHRRMGVKLDVPLAEIIRQERDSR